MRLSAKEIFNGSNYHDWEAKTCFYLKSKGLWKVIEDNPLVRQIITSSGKEIDETVSDYLTKKPNLRIRI